MSHTGEFTYDGANQLATAIATGNSSYNLTFNNDGYGNTSCFINGNTQGLCPQYSFNSHNQISNSGYTYDADGNLAGDGTYTYQYDGEDRLVNVTLNGGTISTMTYNALGEQVRRAFDVTIDHPYDPSGRMAGLFNAGSGTWDEERFWGGGRYLGNYYFGYTYFLHGSGVGSSSPTQITDGEGGLRGNETYYPYGQEWNYVNEVGPYWQYYGGFSRYEWDIGLYLTPTRSYSPLYGRWLTPDPMGGDITNPQSLNRYAYVLNNPATLTDPLGLCPPGTHPANNDEVNAILKAAKSLLSQGISYSQCDCTHFLNTAITKAGWEVPYATTSQIYHQEGPGLYFQPASKMAVGDALLFNFPGYPPYSHGVLATGLNPITSVGSQTSSGPAILPPTKDLPGSSPYKWYENLLKGAKPYQICLPDKPTTPSQSARTVDGAIMMPQGGSGIGGWDEFDMLNLIMGVSPEAASQSNGNGSENSMVTDQFLKYIYQ